jgi:hypothetical protein
VSIRPTIRLKAGEDVSIRIALRAADGSVLNPTGSIIEFRAAVTLAASAVILSKVDGDGIEIVNAGMGLVDIVFLPDDTLSLGGVALYFDLKVIEANGREHVMDFGTNDAEPQKFGLLLIEQPLLLAG